jgi:hypothetical protein
MRQAVQVANNVAFAVTDATIGTTSASGVTIITAIEIANVAAAAGTFNLALTAGATSATAANDDFFQVSVPANTTQSFYGYWVLPASTVIHGMASAITMHVNIHGQLSAAGG